MSTSRIEVEPLATVDLNAGENADINTETNTETNTNINTESHQLRILNGTGLRNSTIIPLIFIVIIIGTLLSSLDVYNKGVVLFWLLFSRMVFNVVDYIHTRYIIKNLNILTDSKLKNHIDLYNFCQMVPFIWTVICIMILNYSNDFSSDVSGMYNVTMLFVIMDILSTIYFLLVGTVSRNNRLAGVRMLTFTRVHNYGDGASQEEINRIHLEKFIKDKDIRINNKQITFNNDYQCPICIMDYEDDEDVRVLGCGHYIHKECVDQWFTLNFTCPICRFDPRKNSHCTEDDMDRVERGYTNPSVVIGGSRYNVNAY
jgi:hypothetical protein